MAPNRKIHSQITTSLYFFPWIALERACGAQLLETRGSLNVNPPPAVSLNRYLPTHPSRVLTFLWERGTVEFWPELSGGNTACQRTLPSFETIHSSIHAAELKALTSEPHILAIFLRSTWTPPWAITKTQAACLTVWLFTERLTWQHSLFHLVVFKLGGSPVAGSYVIPDTPVAICLPEHWSCRALSDIDPRLLTLFILGAKSIHSCRAEYPVRCASVLETIPPPISTSYVSLLLTHLHCSGRQSCFIQSSLAHPSIPFSPGDYSCSAWLLTPLSHQAERRRSTDTPQLNRDMQAMQKRPRNRAVREKGEDVIEK